MCHLPDCETVLANYLITQDYCDFCGVGWLPVVESQRLTDRHLKGCLSSAGLLKRKTWNLCGVSSAGPTTRASANSAQPVAIRWRYTRAPNAASPMNLATAFAAAAAAD